MMRPCGIVDDIVVPELHRLSTVVMDIIVQDPDVRWTNRTGTFRALSRYFDSMDLIIDRAQIVAIVVNHIVVNQPIARIIDVDGFAILTHIGRRVGEGSLIVSNLTVADRPVIALRLKTQRGVVAEIEAFNNVVAAQHEKRARRDARIVIRWTPEN